MQYTLCWQILLFYTLYTKSYFCEVKPAKYQVLQVVLELSASSYSAAEYCIYIYIFFISTKSMKKLELEYLVKKRWSRSKTAGLTFCLYYLYIYKNFLTSHINLSIVHKNLQFLRSLSFILFFCFSTFFIFFCILIIIVYYFVLFLLSHQSENLNVFVLVHEAIAMHDFLFPTIRNQIFYKLFVL